MQETRVVILLIQSKVLLQLERIYFVHKFKKVDILMKFVEDLSSFV